MAKNSAGIDISTFDPAYRITIADTVLGEEITRFIDSVEYESADGYVDMVKLVVQNPDGVFTDSKLFQPGNEINVAFGYGASLSHVGRAILIRPQYRFPEDGIPRIELTGYTKDFLMMDNEPAREQQGKKKRPDRRAFKKPVNLTDMIASVAEEYNFDVTVIGDIDFDRAFVQKAGMSDYEFVKGIANMIGYALWVDGAEDGRWTLHLVKPDDKGIIPDVQDRIYTFEYARGDASTLLSFEPEFALRDVRTKLIVIVQNSDQGKTFVEELTDNSNAPDTISSGDPEDLVTEEQQGGGAKVKLIFGEQFSIETIANKNFRSGADVKRWAQAWFRRNRQEFIQGRGKTIGIENVFARQVHNLTGIGKSLSGQYYFPRVRHQLSADGGYFLDFNARKVVIE